MTSNANTITVEDRFLLQDTVFRYFRALDVQRDIEAVLTCFAADGVLDYQDLEVGIFRGREEMRGFFATVLANSLWQVHLVTNFHVTGMAGSTAKASCYLIGKAHHRGGNPIEITGGCDVECVLIAGEWKIAYIREFPIVPLDGPVADNLPLPEITGKAMPR